jgi:hypothetical protein
MRGKRVRCENRSKTGGRYYKPSWPAQDSARSQSGGKPAVARIASFNAASRYASNAQSKQKQRLGALAYQIEHVGLVTDIAYNVCRRRSLRTVAARRIRIEMSISCGSSSNRHSDEQMPGHAMCVNSVSKASAMPSIGFRSVRRLTFLDQLIDCTHIGALLDFVSAHGKPVLCRYAPNPR